MNPMLHGNRLKLATFCTNNNSFLTQLPENWALSWTSCLAAARRADAAGFDAIVPIARWKGYLDGRPDHPSHQVFDPFIYAAAVAQVTQHATIMATSHAPTVHPILLAKQCATLDHISSGRFALNVVGGWNRREFDMFGVDLLEREARYEYLEEWVKVLRRLWTDDAEFDHEGEYLRLKGAISRPKPLQKPSIPLMNAGHSDAGRRFAAQYCDIVLVQTLGSSDTEVRKLVASYRDFAMREYGRAIQVWTNAIVVQADTVDEAKAYLRGYSVDRLDHEAFDSFMSTLTAETSIKRGSDQFLAMSRNVAAGSGYPLVGDAAGIASQLLALSAAGIDGVLLNWLDPIEGIARLAAHVMPILEEAGVRQPVGVFGH